MAIEVPADQKVVNVFDANVRQWSVEKERPSVQKITVQLFEPAKQDRRTSPSNWRSSPTRSSQGRSGDRPWSRRSGVGRQQGVVVVQVAEGSGPRRADQRPAPGRCRPNCPPSLARGQLGLRLSLRRRPLRAGAGRREGPAADPGRYPRRGRPGAGAADARPAGDLHDRAGRRVPAGDSTCPAGFEVRQVRGRAVAGRAPRRQVDTHHLEGEEKTRLVVNLARKASGRVGLAVELAQGTEGARPADADRQGGQDRRSRFRAWRRARSSGRPAGWSSTRPESLRVNPGKAEGRCGRISVQGGPGGHPLGPAPKPADARPVLAFAYHPGAGHAARWRPSAASRRSRSASCSWRGSKRAWSSTRRRSSTTSSTAA